MGIPYKVDKVRLHERFEKEFEKNVVLPEINKREEALRNRRDLIKSVNLEAIKDHENQYLIKKKELVQRKVGSKKNSLDPDDSLS